ncbi:3-oxo-tetronate kinase [Frigidibacter sp. ROC022]|uniref:3-oxo-tetronate kinase n=1 Tax=Frigidibacter sp. ROC022 TaxID=2971796 RepID=UPI00215AA15B|nr:3-oxo-tetronate kinase [Frigidibacter sp. ROC022]MCR8724565.1 four-carbon acid sugar kinase family protein [Frigidibacter sp. ROC022]
MLLGCIGDDFTGSSDLANTLVKGGMATTQYCGVPDRDAQPDVEAGVVALKTRSLPVEEAVAQSLQALDWLQRQGCQQVFFKYCSTFDSTRTGNIGPVAEALAKVLDASRVIVCPAFPGVGRTIYQGHLFVGDRLLNESGMERHPLTPMTDPDIRRWLQYQTRLSVGLVSFPTVRQGADAIAEALDRQHAEGHGLVVVDALQDEDLLAIGAAAADLPLITGGSGVALGLPENFRRKGLIGNRSVTWDGLRGPGVVLSGSCSRATRAQVALYRQSHPALEITADALMDGDMTVSRAADWLRDHLDEAPLIYSSAEPAVVASAQEKHGPDRLAQRIESFFAGVAAEAPRLGVRRLVSAGGETSGAVVQGLACRALEVGPEIDPGVPMLRVGGQELGLALKSGNFGAEDFFDKALRMLGTAQGRGERET